MTPPSTPLPAGAKARFCGLLAAFFGCAAPPTPAPITAPAPDPCQTSAAPWAQIQGPRDFAAAEPAFVAAQAALAASDFVAARQHLDAALAADVTHALARLARAQLGEIQGADPEHIRADAATAVYLLPKNPRAQITFARIAEPNLALHHWRCAVTLAPESAEAHFNLGRSYLSFGQLSDALTSLEEAYRLGPEVIAHGVTLAAALEQAQKLARAAQVLEDAANKARSAPIYRKAALLWDSLERPQDAARARQAADHLDPPPPARPLRPLPQKKGKSRR